MTIAPYLLRLRSFTHTFVHLPRFNRKLNFFEIYNVSTANRLRLHNCQFIQKIILINNENKNKINADDVMVVGRAFAKRRQSIAPPSLLAAKRNLARQGIFFTTFFVVKPS